MHAGCNVCMIMIQHDARDQSSGYRSTSISGSHPAASTAALSLQPPASMMLTAPPACDEVTTLYKRPPHPSTQTQDSEDGNTRRELIFHQPLHPGPTPTGLLRCSPLLPRTHRVPARKRVVAPPQYHTIELPLFSLVVTFSVLFKIVDKLHLCSPFSNQWPLKALCKLPFTHSCTHSHTDGGGGGVSHAGRQPARRGAVKVRRLAQGQLDTPGIQLATFRLSANLLYLLSHMPPA